MSVREYLHRSLQSLKMLKRSALRSRGGGEVSRSGIGGVKAAWEVCGINPFSRAILQVLSFSFMGTPVS